MQITVYIIYVTASEMTFCKYTAVMCPIFKGTVMITVVVTELNWLKVNDYRNLFVESQIVQ